ncbi:ferredoxin [Candidatus Parcubacteria bacterium]|jgi:ferredoxin|nr:ferredoxin [Candidatus Parcubacteria bacterium]MBT3949332.1 ferredoxin [Candidatus Parcubacteria bacterium]
MAKNIKIDPDKCIGCASCTAVASGTFEMGDDDKAHVIDPPGDDEATIQMAVDCCATQAIEIEE